MRIRKADRLDREEVRRVHLAAFPDSESESVAKLAIDLLLEDTTPETISLVAESDGSLIGHVAFSPVTIGMDKNFQGYILAPLDVLPDHQKHRIGSTLVKNGMQKLSAMGVDILFVYGDPEYYGRFGFRADTAVRFEPPYELQYPFGWQAVALKEVDADKRQVEISCVSSLCGPELW